MNKNYIIAGLLVLILLNGFILDSLQRGPQEDDGLTYHVSAIFPNDHDPYWKQVREGILEEAKQREIAVEFLYPAEGAVRQVSQLLDMAVLSDVDGVICYAAGEAIATQLEEAFDQQIPVALVGQDLPASTRDVYVGSNAYTLGQEAGSAMARAIRMNGNVSIVIGEEEAGGLMIQGIRNVLKRYPSIAVKEVIVTSGNLLADEATIVQLANSLAELDGIVATSAVDTVAVTQLITEMDQVGSVQIVGGGSTPEILEYIEDGLLYATVTNEPVAVGQKSVEALHALFEGQELKTYIDIEVETITEQEVRDAYE